MRLYGDDSAHPMDAGGDVNDDWIVEIERQGHHVPSRASGRMQSRP